MMHDDHIHEHEHGHEHEHVHFHTHEHEHAHEHAHDSGEETLALLNYMLQHNRHHAEELSELQESLSAAGKNEAAEKVGSAIASFAAGNYELEAAIELLK